MLPIASGSRRARAAHRPRSAPIPSFPPPLTRPQGLCIAYAPPPLDCTAMATDCVPAGPCRPACDCVLARDHVIKFGAVESCTLVAGAGPPEVEVRYQQTVFCGGD
jgi:hypothetical protein